MDAVSYPQKFAADFIMDKLVPLRVPADSKPLPAEFGVQWTPTLVVLDAQGQEHSRTVGFLPPEDLVAALQLGMAKVSFDTGNHDLAINRLNAVLNSYPNSSSAPEALYLRGVAKFKATHDASALKEAYEQLSVQYPQSEWVRRAQPYRLL